MSTGTGELLGSEITTVPTSGDGIRTVGETIAEALNMILKVPGNAEDAVQEDASLRPCASAASSTVPSMLDPIKRDQEVLGLFYQNLLAPVEDHLKGAQEVLILPHKELFDVPWAALFDSKTGEHLIER